jgi:hypothetical protein
MTTPKKAVNNGRIAPTTEAWVAGTINRAKENKQGKPITIPNAAPPSRRNCGFEGTLLRLINR